MRLNHENGIKIDERHIFVDESAFFFDKSSKKFCRFQTNHYICRVNIYKSIFLEYIFGGVLV